jgi:2-polyprenyl-3-methyl-5-hydroxy-6-metoxy-1,4-benzoquinol methylase
VLCGIDSDQGATQSFIKQAEFCKLVLGLDVDFRRQGLLDLPESPQFDLILFLGVLYHLPNFCDGLDRLRRLCKPGGIVAVESQVATRSVITKARDSEGIRQRSSFRPSVF